MIIYLHIYRIMVNFILYLITYLKCISLNILVMTYFAFKYMHLLFQYSNIRLSTYFTTVKYYVIISFIFIILLFYFSTYFTLFCGHYMIIIVTISGQMNTSNMAAAVMGSSRLLKTSENSQNQHTY